MNFTKLSNSLQLKGYKVQCFDNHVEASNYLNASIDETNVAFGGSVTLQQMNLFDLLSSHNTVLWHWRRPEGKTASEIRREAMVSDIYISSVNAIAETGEIINIDGTCNRISSMLFGHKILYLVIGKNKIAPDFSSALDRARNIAAPMNAKRLNRKTPCAVKGDRCYNCSSPERICNALSVFWQKPDSMEVEVILIQEDLGY